MPEQLIQLEIIDDNPYQDRGSYEDISELGRTIAVNGLEQKPKARLVGKRYQLKFGHRRKRAFEWLRDHYETEGLPNRYSGYSVMPLDVEDITDKEMFDGVVIENVHRDDLKVTEKARLLRRYKEVNPEATSEQNGDDLMAANRCSECHRPLKDPYSIAIGIGPECRGRMIKGGWKMPKPKWNVEGGRTVFAGVTGKVEPPAGVTKKENKVKHGKRNDQPES